VISTFTNSQIAALFATALITLIPAVQYSGIIDPVSSLQGAGAVIGALYPTTYFVTISRGAFSKALGFADCGHRCCLCWRRSRCCWEPASRFSGNRRAEMNLANVLHLGIKELRGLRREPLLLVLILHAFTLAIYTGAKAMPETLNRAAIAIVDEDRSPVSSRIITSFYPPYFSVPQLISQQEMDTRMDAGTDTFALDIPPDFQRDLLAGRSPTIQLNVDATRMTQAFTGGGYVQSIVTGEVNEFLQHTRSTAAPPVDLDLRARFNPHLSKSWFGAITEVISSVTMLSIILTGAALIREREHGTVEHLLVMPVTPAEIMLSKIWSMGLVVLVASALSLVLVVQGLLAVPIRGSLALFILGAALDLFAMTSLASSWRRSPVPCRSSGCFWCWCCCRCRCFPAASPPAREHARDHPVHHAGRAQHALHHAVASRAVPRGGAGRGLAAACGAAGDRDGAVRLLPAALPCIPQMSGLRGAAARLADPSGELSPMASLGQV